MQIARMLKQKMVYWARSGTDKNGQPKYLNPAEVSCRWEDKVEEGITATGEIVHTTSIAYCEQDLMIGSKVKLGALAGTELNPKDDVDAREVVRIEKHPNLRASQFLRVAYLKV